MISAQDSAASSSVPLWVPSPQKAESAFSARLRQLFNERTGTTCKSYAEFHAASVEDRGEFWSLVWDDCGLVGEKGERLLINDTMPGAQFFPDAKINYGENSREFEVWKDDC